MKTGCPFRVDATPHEGSGWQVEVI
jgi:hypothetical protein